MRVGSEQAAKPLTDETSNEVTVAVVVCQVAGADLIGICKLRE